MLLKLNYATGIDKSDSLIHLIHHTFALKAEVEKLGINKLVNVPTSLNNLKTKLNDLDVGKLKTVPVDLKKIK